MCLWYNKGSKTTEKEADFCEKLGDTNMNGEGKKYQIDTEENRRFLKEIRENLLEFGKQFPSPAGSSWYLGDDGTPWKDLSLIHISSFYHPPGRPDLCH